MKNKVRVFEHTSVRSVWDEENEKWWFSILDVITVLTESTNPQVYWRVLKKRLTDEGNETVTNCNALKMRAPDGKMRLTDVADTEQLFRLIQSIPSKKAEPFKLWLAKVGRERIDEAQDPERTIDRAIYEYRQLGYSEDWINLRLKSIEVRKGLTDEWDKSGVRRGQEYAFLTDLMYKTWADMTTREYKKHKGLKQENLRDNMTNTELVLNMLAEVAATDISTERQPDTFDKSADIAQEGAKAAKVARRQIEKSTGKKVISNQNAKNIRRLK